MAQQGDYEKMSGRERAICTSLCICLALSVMSAVSLVYLTVIVYLPAQRELNSGLGQSSVMCTTVENKRFSGDIEACRWSSCSEWCLSKGGGDCNHLYVSVRTNGTDLMLEDCTAATEALRLCPSLDMDTIERRNCKEDHQCSRLDTMFRCEDGMCYNITAVHVCKYDEADTEPPLNCVKKRNCVELTGMFDCKKGRCRRVNKYECERRCLDIPIGDGRNVVMMAGDRFFSAECRRAVDRRTMDVIWRADAHMDEVFMTSCTSLNATPAVGGVSAYDCVNGTLLPMNVFPASVTNYTYLTSTFHTLGPANKLDPKSVHVPFEKDLTIFNFTRLMINTEGCVNTLSYECDLFFHLYGQDGRNMTSPARYPCYYSPDNTDFVVTRFDPGSTRWNFFLFFVVPASCLFVSCSFLFICTRILNIDNTGHMVIECCGEGCCRKRDDRGRGDLPKMALNEIVLNDVDVDVNVDGDGDDNNFNQHDERKESEQL